MTKKQTTATTISRANIVTQTCGRKPFLKNLRDALAERSEFLLIAAVARELNLDFLVSANSVKIFGGFET